uniref:Lipoprotein n=1 Tax=Streptomyces sp. NBC_00003 TaxID=2903608 RepID=A0AAU2V675_9ACTN
MSSVRTRGSWLLAVPLFLAVGCSGPAPPENRPDPDDIIKAATQRLTDHCLSRQGLAPPRPGRSPTPEQQQKVSAALFGAGPAQLSVGLPTGYVVRAHTDGCLAAAQQRLYGDQPGWFRASVIVNNFQPEADHNHQSLAEVRARHPAEIADFERLRAHALSQATALLSNSTTTGEPSP